MHTQLSQPSESLSPALDLPTMPAPSRKRLYIWLALLASGPLLLLLLVCFRSLDQSVLRDPLLHVLITAFASIIGVVLALLVLHVAHRAQDGRVFLIGMGFLSTAAIFINHSISTPNVLMSGRGLATMLSGSVSLMVGGIFFALSGLNLSPAFNRGMMRHARLWLVALLIFWIAYNWALLVTLPSITAAQPAATPVAATGAHDAVHSEAQTAPGPREAPPESTAAQVEVQQPPAVRLPDWLRTIVVVVGLGCYAFAISRHYTFYRRSPSLVGLGLITGMAFFGEAQLSQYFSKSFAISFWLYHVQEFTGYAVIAYTVLGAYRRGLTDETLMESLLLSGTRARLQAGYAKAMESLVQALSRGEQPTPALRVALRARFGLAESQVRVLEEAATAVAQERRQREELEQLNQSLRQLEAHRDQLTQMIIHDLKNPLTALVGFLEILRMDSLNDNQRSLLGNALRSGRNLSNLIGDLLDVGRIEEGRLELERQLIAPRDLLDECAGEMRGWTAQECKTIAVDAPDDLPELCADPRLMRRVMMNLLSNAIKHTPTGTHIALRASHHVLLPAPATEDDTPAVHQIVIEVEDNGPGIPAEHLERIFEKFGRFSAEQPARQDSTGLGLTLCRLVVEAHGGTIGVTSTVGQGTAFRVTLPGVV